MIAGECGKHLEAFRVLHSVDAHKHMRSELRLLCWTQCERIPSTLKQEYLPSHFPEATNSEGSFLARSDLLNLTAAVPRKNRPVDEVILRFVRLENGQLPICERLLRRGNCRVVECQT